MREHDSRETQVSQDAKGIHARRDPFINDEGGFTTPAAAIALLLVLSLLFMCADGYRVGTRAGQIQYVADAGALAADNVVAEFVTIGQVVDSALLTFSLAIVTLYAVSAVCAFIPGVDAVSEPLASAASKLINVRNKFSKSAIKGLDTLQKALPAICAVRAAQVVQANAQASGQEYYGIAITCPMKGVNNGITKKSKKAKEERKKQNKSAKEATGEIDAEEETVVETVDEIEEDQEQADKAKEEAWEADCGAKPNNMQERAKQLAGLTGNDNPKRSTVDTWSFSMALSRAKKYYAARISQERGSGLSGETGEVKASIARKKYYEYALKTVSSGTVTSTKAGAEKPNFKKVAINLDGLKSTYLYTEAVYPLSKKEKEGKEGKEGKLTLHAWTGCPGYSAGTPAGLGSLKGIDEGSCEKCKTCKYTMQSLASVPRFTGVQSVGFEYWYNKMVDASESYRSIQEKIAKQQAELDTSRETIADKLKKLADAIKGQRYDPQPPGRYGCICIVYAPEKRYSTLPFLGKAGTMPARVAISGATLAPDAASDQGTVVADVAKGLAPGDSTASLVIHALFSVWGASLKLYSDANSGIESIISTVFGTIPVVGDELSTRAVSSFQTVLNEAGLQPAKLQTYKPVLANTSQIVDGLGSKNVIRVAVKGLKKSAEVYSAVETEDLRALLDTLGVSPNFGGRLKDGRFTVATLSFSLLGLEIASTEVTIPIPDEINKLYKNAKSSIQKYLEAA